MLKHQEPQLPVVAHFNRSSSIPSRSIHSHNCILPHGLALSHVQFPANPWQFVVPALPEDHLVLHLERVMDLHGKIVKNFQIASKPGDIYIVPHGEATEWHHTGEGQILLLFLAPSLLTDLALEVMDIDPVRVNLIERVATSDPLIQAIGQAFLSELQSAGLAGRLYTESLTNTLLLHLLRHYVAAPQSPPACKGGLATPTLRLVLEYIQAHLADDLTLAKLAKEAHLSPYHFMRLFQHSTGESLHQYVIRQRVEAAKRLLLHEPLTLADIASQVGFADQSHLGRHFKRLVGVTPKTLLDQRKNLPKNRKNLQDFHVRAG